jgi:hypothetical protein
VIDVIGGNPFICECRILPIELFIKYAVDDLRVSLRGHGQSPVPKDVCRQVFDFTAH